MKLSIIIPVYNVEKYIQRCLDSCIKQNIPLGEYEIIIVNDGTQDNSLAIAESYAKRYSFITIISQKNQGLSIARNEGLNVAQGDYVWFIDSDDWIKENCLKEILDQLYQNNLEALAICAANNINDINIRRFSYSKLETINGKDALKKYIPVCAPFTIYSREFLNKYNFRFYKGIFHEDNEFTYRTYYHLNRVGFTNEILYFVYQNPNSITRVFNPKKSYDMLIVANSILKFMDNVDKDYKVIYHNEIGQLLNYALYGVIEADKSVIEKFNQSMNDNKHLFKCLIKSNILKYKLEGILFLIFPNNTFYVYSFLQKFNRKHKI